MSTWYHLIFAVHQAEFQVGRIIDTLPLLIEFYTVILLIQSNSISFSDTLRVASKELKTIISAIKFFSIPKAWLVMLCCAWYVAMVWLPRSGCVLFGCQFDVVCDERARCVRWVFVGCYSVGWLPGHWLVPWWCLGDRSLNSPAGIFLADRNVILWGRLLSPGSSGR